MTVNNDAIILAAMVSRCAAPPALTGNYTMLGGEPEDWLRHGFQPS